MRTPEHLRRNPRTVSAALRRAGIPTGYRYSQSVITGRDGRPITEHGVMVGRTGTGRRNRGEDLGHVRISPVFVHEPRPAGEPPRAGDRDRIRADEERFVARIVVALTAADIPVERAGHLAVIVPDLTPEEISR